MNPLQITDTFTLATDADARRMAFVGMSGSGKTSGAKVVVEKLIRAGRRVAILDPAGVHHGLRLSADGQSPGLPFVVFGGRHADVPLEATAGAAVADLAVEEHLPVILDLSEFEDDASLCRVSEDFVRRLRRLQNPDREPLLLVVDEADLLAPQNPTLAQKGSRDALVNVARRSRSDGLGLLVITQRPASITKDVLTQAEAVFLMRFSGYTDLKAVEDWIGTYLTLEERKSVVSALPTLADGECFVTSPSWMHTFQRLRFPLPETFDSSATPKAGARRPRMEARAEVDRTALAARFAAAIREEQESDPAVLKARIAELERRVREVKPERVEVPVIKEVPVYVSRLDEAHVQRLTDKAEDFRAVAKDHINLGLELVAAANEILAELRQAPAPNQPSPIFVGEGKQEGSDGILAQKEAVEAVSTPKQAISPPPQKTSPLPVREGVDPRLRKGEVRILTALARCHRATLTPAQLGTLSKLTPGAGTWNEYIGRLKMERMLVQEGGAFRITAAGLTALGKDVPAEPMTTQEVLDLWRPALKAKEVQMLDLLVERHPLGLKPQSIAQQLGLTHGAGTFNGYLGTLKQNGLVTVGNGMVFASHVLFPEEGHP